MNISRAIFIGAASFGAVLSAAEPTIEFTGVLTAGGKTRIALTDKTQKTTTWVEPGEVFNGYTIDRYDAKEDAIFLKKGGQETRIGLVASKSTPGKPAQLDAASPSTQAMSTSIQSNLRQLTNAARQYQLERGVTTVGYNDLVGPDKLIKELKPVAGENYSTLNFGPNVTAVSVTTSTGAIVALEVPPSVVGSVSPTPASPVVPTTLPALPAATAVPALPTATTSETLPPLGRPATGPSYMIRSGDTWQRVSESTGIPVPQLRQMNPTFLDGTNLPAGQTLRIR